MANPLIPQKGDSKYKFVDVPHSAGILDNHSIRQSANVQQINAGKIVIQNDSAGGTTPQVLNIIYGTAAVGTLTASDYPIGTIYIQYTA